MLIGREQELATLRDLMASDEAQFVAVYGRRRVGKTFLIREAFKENMVFQHTGTYGATRQQQLSDFRESLYLVGMKKSAMPKTWSEAFGLLWRYLTTIPQSEKKKVIFIDELPWMDTPKSNFVRSLDHFWNGWVSTRKDIILVICGSATSWIIDNVVMNYGGLHNRLTCKIHLQPFMLNECKQYCESKHLGYKDRQILEAYMVMGGVPYYWSFLKKGQSVAQNFDRMFFQPGGELSQEFEALYASLFKKPHRHLSIITALAKKKKGMLREELRKASKLADNADFSKALQELEQCGFIRKYTCIGKKSKDAIYQLIDNYTLFYFDFISENVNGNEHFWSASASSALHYSWAGRAFERVCMQHVNQIKAALGFSAVISSVHSWSTKGKKDPVSGQTLTKGAQIDMLIDRNDDTINLCEIKYTNAPYVITEEEDERIRNRCNTFISDTGTHKTVLITMITSYGLAPGGYAYDVHCQVTMDDLFR